MEQAVKRNSEKHRAEVSIMGRSFTVSGEDPTLILEAAEFLNDRIREIHDKGSSVASLNVAVLTALNISYEFLELRRRYEAVGLKSRHLLELIDGHLSDDSTSQTSSVR